MKKIILSLMLAMVGMVAQAQVQNMLGDWTTIDDGTGEKKSIVNIYKGTDGKYYGKIVKLLQGDRNKVCTECTGTDKGKKMEGLIIVRGMKEDGKELVGGKILDPANGKFYYAKMSLKDGKLVLRGSIDKYGMLGRSQTWIRK